MRKASNLTGARLDLSETLIRHAFMNGKSAAGAARYLNVSYNTLRKYARLYIDEESGLTLFELFKNPSGTGIKKSKTNADPIGYLNSILNGERPKISASTVLNLLMKHAILPSECCSCGFNESRITDYKLPVMLDFIDGDRTNYSLVNLRILCYNCFFLLVGNLHSAKIQKYDW